MPFITEEIWHQLQEDNASGDCIVSAYSKPSPFDQQVIDKMEQAKDIITNIRDVRNKNGIKMKDTIEVVMIQSERAQALIDFSGWADLVARLANLSGIAISSDENMAGAAFISGTEKCIVVMQQAMDIDTEIKEKSKELAYQQGFVASVQAKLNNDRFVSSAPEVVVAKEKAKLADGLERIRILEDDIQRLRSM